MPLPTHDDVAAAAARIAPYVVRTPMLRSEALDALTGGTVLLKAKSLQRTGSFKLRGATNALRQFGEAAASRRRGDALLGQPRPGGRLCRGRTRRACHRVHAEPMPLPSSATATAGWGADDPALRPRLRDDREALSAAFAAATGAT